MVFLRTDSLRVTVEHRPYPKGSMRCLGRGRHINQLVGTKPYGDAVTEAAKLAMQEDRPERFPIRKPTALYVDVTFAFPRPKSTPKSHQPVTRSTGDIDKLQRNLLDALQAAGVMEDDSQVVDIWAHQIFTRDADSSAGWTSARLEWRAHD